MPFLSPDDIVHSGTLKHFFVLIAAIQFGGQCFGVSLDGPAQVLTVCDSSEKKKFPPILSAESNGSIHSAVSPLTRACGDTEDGGRMSVRAPNALRVWASLGWGSKGGRGGDA